MTFAPPTLTELADYVGSFGVANLGIVGDMNHVATGVSYHLGRDQLAAGAYSAKTLRDRLGLSNAASAIDLGRVVGSLERLQTLSKRLVTLARENAPGTNDIREIIYSPDGRTVLRHDRERGFASAPRPGEASDSHLTHTHISFYRDAEFRDHRIVFRAIMEDVMSVPTIVVAEPLPGARVTLTLGDALYDTPGGTAIRHVDDTDDLEVAALFRTHDDTGGVWIGVAIPSTVNPPSRLVYVRRNDVDVIRPDAGGDIAAAITAERARIVRLINE